MRAIERYLYRHSNGTYYYRHNFPALSCFQPFEIITSLKTKDIQQAKGDLLALRFVTSRLMKSVDSYDMRKRMKQLSQEDFKKIIRDFIKESLKRLRVQVETGNHFYEELQAKIETEGGKHPELDSINWIDSKAYLVADGFSYDGDCISKLQKERGGETIRFPELPNVIGFNEDNETQVHNPDNDDILRWLYLKHDISDTVAQGTTNYKKLSRRLKFPLAYLDYCHANEKLGDSEGRLEPEDWMKVYGQRLREARNVVSSNDRVKQALPSSKKISELMPLYFSKLRIEEARETTIKDKNRTLDLLIEIIGDIPINDFDDIGFQKVENTILSLPKNWRKKYSNKRPEDFIGQEFCVEERRSRRTINKEFEVFRAFFNWAISSRHYHLENPFTKEVMLKQNKRKKPKKREGYDSASLKKLFSTPIYQGCAGKGNLEKYKSGNIILDTPMFWIPLIGTYTGLRRNEICSLNLRDIKKVEGVWVFDIIEDGIGKAVKALPSQRQLPIHHKILEMGLLDRVASLKEKGHERLFPELGLDSQGTYGDAFGKSYAYVAKKFDFKTKNNCFHSFRHTIKTKLREVGCIEYISNYITGHSNNKSEADKYGDAPDLKIIKEWVDKIDYPEINDLLKSSMKNKSNGFI